MEFRKSKRRKNFIYCAGLQPVQRQKSSAPQLLRRMPCHQRCRSILHGVMFSQQSGQQKRRRRNTLVHTNTRAPGQAYCQYRHHHSQSNNALCVQHLHPPSLAHLSSKATQKQRAMGNPPRVPLLFTSCKQLVNNQKLTKPTDSIA